jgi:TP901 family phage tail tape measure protein
VARSVVVRLGADITDLTAKLRQAGTSVRGFTGELDKAAKGGQLDEVANQAGMLGLGLVAAAGAAIKFAADFDKQMSSVSAATKASAADLDRLRAAALQAGKDTSFSATEAAKGIEELAKAGVSTAAILSGGLNGALDLAAAGGLEVAEAAEIAASAMTQFKLEGGQVPHVADLLAAAAGKAQGSVHDMGMALSQAGLVAAQMGLSVEDTTGTLAAFASAGLMGSDAGTSLKAGLLMLAAPSAKAAELMEQLGIHAYDASGQFVGITALAGQLKTQLGGLTQEQRNSALATIFGADAIRAASVLYTQGSEGIQKWIDKTDDTGYAADTAAKKLDNLAGDVERLKGSLETLAIESATGASSGLRTMVQAADRLVGSLAAIPAPVQNAAVLIVGVGGAALLAAAGAAKLRSATSGALGQLSEMGPAGDRAAKGLDRAAQFATKAAVALAAVQAASAVMGSSTNAQIGMLSKNLAEYGKSGEAAGEITRLFNEDLGNLRYDLGTMDSGFWADFGNGTAGVIEGLTGLGSVMDQSLVHAKERIGALDSALAELVQGGRAGEAEAAFKRLAEEAEKQGVSVEELKLGLPQYAAALDAATTSTTGAAEASGEASEAVGGVAKAAKDAQEQIDAMKEAFDNLFDVQMSIDEAAINSAEAINNLSESIKDNGRTTNLNTEQGRANREAILSRIKTIKDERQARIDNGMQMDVANGKYVKEIDALRKTLRQAGFTKKQIDELTGAYRKIPEKVNTSVGVSGDKGVVNRLQTLYAYQNALRIGKPMADIRKQLSRDNADFLKFDSGGWTGPGATHDPAGIVHADEYVIKKASRKRIEMSHPGLLDEMNATGQMPGYARGGWVWPYPVNTSRTRVPSQREAASKVIPEFGAWPSSPGAQRGDSGVWLRIMAMVGASGIPYHFGNAYRGGDPLWHGSGRAIDYMGYNQDRLARFFMGMQSKVLELIHTTSSGGYYITRGRRVASMGVQDGLHRNHLHIAMAGGGIINEPVLGVGASGATYSFGEGGRPEAVTPLTWRPGSSAAAGGMGGSGGARTVIVDATIPIQIGAETIVRTVHLEIDTVLGQLADARVYNTA